MSEKPLDEMTIEQLVIDACNAADAETRKYNAWRDGESAEGSWMPHRNRYDAILAEARRRAQPASVPDDEADALDAAIAAAFEASTQRRPVRAASVPGDLLAAATAWVEHADSYERYIAESELHPGDATIDFLDIGEPIFERLRAAIERARAKEGA